MRQAAVMGLAASVILGAGDGQGAETTGHEVAVYVQNQQLVDPLLLARAKALAVSLHAGAGVRLEWKLGSPRKGLGCQSPPDAEIVLRFATRTPADFHPGATAYALPYAPRTEVRVTVFCDRVLSPVVGNLNVGAILLGHVLAHEIAHVLQGITRHSEQGVMKARYTPQDRAQMRQGPLAFTPHDVQLIQAAMARGKCATELAAR